METINKKSLRTMTFVPGYMKKFLTKAIDFNSDALILDLEDSVPDEFKEEARKNIKLYLDRNIYSQQIYIRVNAANSGLLTEDLKWTLHENTNGIIFTKVLDERDIFYFDKLLDQFEKDHGYPPKKFKISPLIETGSAVLSAINIATASSRVNALIFGAEDYLTDLDGLHKEHGTSLIVPRSLIVMAARSVKIDAIDTPYLDIRDSEGFSKEVAQARELGFSGQLIVHPSQIEIANKAFTPTDKEIEDSKRIIEAIGESKKRGLGVALLDGKLIGPPMRKRAFNVIAKLKRIRNVEEKRPKKGKKR